MQNDILVSIVIPCYNHGEYLEDCLESVFSYPDQNQIEIILINDGSTDQLTIAKMAEVAEKHKQVQVINQSNVGLATTRNKGISMAKGKYILPLDADNKIKKEYIELALPILKAGNGDIVYAKPSFFGTITQSRIFATNSFNEESFLTGNYIDACAIYRKEVWLKNLGYDANMPYPGFEDWDFWVSSVENGFKFYFIDQELYDYRIVENSMIVRTNALDKTSACHIYIIKKHAKFFLTKICELESAKNIMAFEKKHPLRTAIKYFLRFLKIK